MNMAYIAHEIGIDVKLWFEHGSLDAATLKAFNSIAEWKEWAPTSRLRGVDFEQKHLRPLQGARLMAFPQDQGQSYGL